MTYNVIYFIFQFYQTDMTKKPFHNEIKKIVIIGIKGSDERTIHKTCRPLHIGPQLYYISFLSFHFQKAYSTRLLKYMIY